MLKALGEVPPKTIIKSFKACALNIHFNGSENGHFHFFFKKHLCHILSEPYVNSFTDSYGVLEVNEATL